MFFIEAKSNFAKSETMLRQIDVKFKSNKETDKSITVNMSVYEVHKETTGFGSFTKSEKKSSKNHRKEKRVGSFFCGSVLKCRMSFNLSSYGFLLLIPTL